MLNGGPGGFQIEVRPGPCWGYVGSFFALGRLFRSRAHLKPLLAHLERFLVARSPFFRVLGRSKHDFGVSGQGFGGSETLFCICYSH